MPAISRIQTGSVSLAVGTTSATATPSTFVVDDSLLLFTVSITNRTYAARIEFGRIRGVVTNTTTLTFDRGVAAVCDIEIRWTLIEFASGALAHPIRRGTASITTDPTDLTISTVNDTSSAVILSYLIGNSYGVSYPTGYLTSATNLRIDLDAAPASGDCQIAYQVVSFKPADAVSYTGANTFAALDTSDVVAITSVDTTKALAYGSFIISSAAVVPRCMIRMRITGATSLTLDRVDAGGGSTPTARWHVLEMKDASRVEAWSTTLQAANTSPTTQPSWASAMTNGAVWEQGTWPNARNTDYRALQNDIATRITLDSPQDSITITRGYGAASYDVELAGHVIEFGGVAGATAPGATFISSASMVAGAVTAASTASGKTLLSAATIVAGAVTAASTASGNTLLSAATIIAGAAAASSAAPGATLTSAATLIGGAASGASGSTAPGATLVSAASLVPGAASASSSASGATLNSATTLIGGAASGSSGSTAPGATLAAGASLVPGAVTASSTAPGAVLASAATLVPGAASGGSSGVAPGAVLLSAATLVVGIAFSGAVAAGRVLTAAASIVPGAVAATATAPGAVLVGATSFIGGAAFAGNPVPAPSRVARSPGGRLVVKSRGGSRPSVSK